MPIFHYSKYKILIDPESSKIQGLQTGDIIRRQYQTNNKLIYSLMVVLETGIDLIREKESHYFIGALLEGDEPENGELLDFIRVSNLFNTNRSGALYLTPSDSGAPFLDVLDNLAYDSSFSYPTRTNGFYYQPDKTKYSAEGTLYLTESYQDTDGSANRIYRITRNQLIDDEAIIGFRQGLTQLIDYPERVVISYKIKACKEIKNAPVSFGNIVGEKDGNDTIDITTEWEYKLLVVSVDYPSHFEGRTFFIDLTRKLDQGEFCEIADLNIILLSSISNFTAASKSRVGKIEGIIDPVFGTLEGYGAYFQNLFATKNVNIAGTLTASDENGFGSTFYVGKIHKNVILNSTICEFTSGATLSRLKSPTGIGNSYQFSDTEVSLLVQTKTWTNNHHSNKEFCFSFWIRYSKKTTLSFYQNNTYLQDLEIDTGNDWKRYHIRFRINHLPTDDMYIVIKNVESGIVFSSPQLELGSRPSQYQPTDGILNDTEEYGAWFSQGGIGGTIQNPLLKLNPDGSISSKDNSFVINQDGTGHFASGRFKWTKDTISLQDVTIKWEDLSEDAQDNMAARSVSLSGNNTFHYTNELDPFSCEPNEIIIIATEHNYISTQKKWEYLSADLIWKEIPGELSNHIKVKPTSHYWEERTVLSFRYTSLYKNQEYRDTFTINKLSDGHSSYSLYINSTNGNIFKNNVVSTVLTAHLYKGGEEITDLIPDNNFRWLRISNKPEEDISWNNSNHIGKTLEISENDVLYKAVFDCEVTIPIL